MTDGRTAIPAVRSVQNEPPSEHALYKFLVESLHDYAVFAVSPTGIVISWNSGAEQTFGYTQAEVIGLHFSIIFTPEDRSAGAPDNELATALSREEANHDRWHVRKNGTRFWGTNTVAALYDGAGALLGFTKLVRDTTQEHLAFEELSDSEQQLRLLIESVRDFAIFSISVDGKIRTWSAGAEKVFGYSRADCVGRNVAFLYNADDAVAGLPAAEMHTATLHGFANTERWLVRKDGSKFLASGKLSQLERDAAGERRGFVSIVHDITDSHAAAQDLRHRAQNDALTDLPNRRTFYEHVARAIALMKRRSSTLFAVLFIDLDHFKSVNDIFGHIIADQLLAATARRLEVCIRSEDIVARIGGDEFAVLLNGISGVGDAHEAADRIGEVMRAALTIDQREVRCTVSIGIAMGALKYGRPEDILRDADAAMYTAKTAGRARSVVYTPSQVTDGRGDIDLIADLRLALEHDELRIAYQPILALKTGALAGFEALVRWQHPRRGYLMPADFITRAEASDLIIAIDRWVIGAAARQLTEWQTRGVVGESVSMSVNVSSRELSRDSVVSDVTDALALRGLQPQRLRLEITEHSIMERSEAAYATLTALRAVGLNIDIDDFGTGFSSLGALAHIDIDALKIDASFIKNMATPHGEKLVESIIVLAHKIDAVVVAEGIETADQLARLVELDCDYGQGYYFARGLDAADAGAFAEANSARAG